jgi:hypothetical protein
VHEVGGDESGSAKTPKTVARLPAMTELRQAFSRSAYAGGFRSATRSIHLGILTRVGIAARPTGAATAPAGEPHGSQTGQAGAPFTSVAPHFGQDISDSIPFPRATPRAHGADEY